MKLFIWGAGEIGGRIYRHLEPDDVVAFIDSDEEKLKQKYCGKNIISFQQYIDNHQEGMILLAHINANLSADKLKKNNIYNFFLLSDCPGELQEPNTRNYLKEYVEMYLNSLEKYVIYGITLYTVLIDRWIYKKKGIHPLVVPQAGIDERLLECVKENFKDMNIVRYEELKTLNVKEICKVVPEIDKIVQSDLKKLYQYTDLYDCSGKISKYRNRDIEVFKNRHKNERCFIVATGPSLRIEDLETLDANKEITISVNSIFHAFYKTKWRPTYYVTDDYRGIKKNSEVIEKIALSAAFVGDTYAPFWENKHGIKIHKFHKHYEYYNDKMPKFTDDFAQRSYTGLTVTYTCLQLAVYMGFKEIYLLGVDFSYQNQKEKYVHFYKEEKLVATGFGKQVHLAYLSAKEYAEKQGIKIYNATRGGKLEVFERINFDGIFKERA